MNRKIADYLCHPAAGNLLGGLDNVAIGSARHHAILHLAARGQLASQPQSKHQQENRNGEARYRATPVVALVGIGHRPLIALPGVRK
jgi:membrane protein YqaA with SNARE-associated domain